MRDISQRLRFFTLSIEKPLIAGSAVQSSGRCQKHVA